MLFPPTSALTCFVLHCWYCVFVVREMFTTGSRVWHALSDLTPERRCQPIVEATGCTVQSNVLERFGLEIPVQLNSSVVGNCLILRLKSEVPTLEAPKEFQHVQANFFNYCLQYEENVPLIIIRIRLGCHGCAQQLHIYLWRTLWGLSFPLPWKIVSSENYPCKETIIFIHTNQYGSSIVSTYLPVTWFNRMYISILYL
jgi:hypothetical protein